MVDLNGSAVVTGEVGVAPSVYLTVGGQKFLCRRVSVTWQLMQFAKAQQAANITVPRNLPEDHPKRKELEEKRNAAGMKLLSTMYDTIMKLLDPRERDSFEDFMSTADLEPDELEKAIGDVISAIGNDDESGKPQEASAHSSASHQPTNDSVRVISLGQAMQPMQAADAT